MDMLKLLEKCTLCPRRCDVNRLNGSLGYCKSGVDVLVARSMLHEWEEPCISGGKGSGTVFFSKCSMSCVFCQNHDISQEDTGKLISISRLCDIFLELEERNANNINLVSPTHFVPQIIEALSMAKGKGLSLPIVYNSNGYENVDTLKYLDGYVDVYLPDIKYFSNKYSLKYSKTPDYFKYASSAVLEMYHQVGSSPCFKDGIIQKGLIIRHLLLPGLLSESKRILDWIVSNLPKSVYISLMSQYVPMYKAEMFPEIYKRVSPSSYEWLVDYALSLGLENGFIQELDSAENIYTPKFDLDGV